MCTDLASGKACYQMPIYSTTNHYKAYSLCFFTTYVYIFTLYSLPHDVYTEDEYI